MYIYVCVIIVLAGIYLENSHHCALQLTDLEFGVTTLRWSPCGNMLWVGGRKHESIVCWDVRYTRSEVGRVKRGLWNNQRMGFDLDPWNARLITGSQMGE